MECLHPHKATERLLQGFLSDCYVEDDIDLSERIVPHGIELRDAKIEGDLLFYNIQVTGDGRCLGDILLKNVQVRGKVNAMRAKLDGGFYMLDGTTVEKTIYLDWATMNHLSISGVGMLGGLEMKEISVRNGIALYNNQGPRYIRIEVERAGLIHYVAPNVPIWLAGGLPEIAANPGAPKT